MEKIINAKIADLEFDDKNANLGTQVGRKLMLKSFKELGAGRSILLDKNDRIIGGNKSAETALELGMEDVIIVETDGTKLIAVKRTDIDLDSKIGREMAIADNATSFVNLEWDEEIIEGLKNDWEIDPKDWGLKEFSEIDYSEKNKEIEVEDYKNEMTLKLTYTENDYSKVKNAIAAIGGTPEGVFFKLLKCQKDE